VGKTEHVCDLVQDRRPDRCCAVFEAGDEFPTAPVEDDLSRHECLPVAVAYRDRERDPSVRTRERKSALAGLGPSDEHRSPAPSVTCRLDERSIGSRTLVRQPNNHEVQSTGRAEEVECEQDVSLGVDGGAIQVEHECNGGTRVPPERVTAVIVPPEREGRGVSDSAV
jgi:hypothetical protein